MYIYISLSVSLSLCLSMALSMAVWFSSTVGNCRPFIIVFSGAVHSKPGAAVPALPALLHAPVQGSRLAGPRRRDVVAHPWPRPWV